MTDRAWSRSHVLHAEKQLLRALPRMAAPEVPIIPELEGTPSATPNGPAQSLRGGPYNERTLAPHLGSVSREPPILVATAASRTRLRRCARGKVRFAINAVANVERP
jgi:hypothetical protein